MENPDPAGRSLKRKLEPVDQTDPNVEQPCPNFSTEILQQVSLLNSALSPSASDRAAVKSAVLAIVKLIREVWLTPAEDLIMDTLVSCRAVPVIMRHLQAPEAVKDDSDNDTQHFLHEVEEGCGLILAFLTIKPEHQQIIIDAGALPCLIDLLRRHKISTISQPLIGLLRRAADAIFNLARKNTIIRTLVRMEGGIPPLVELLEFNVTEVQRSAAIALQALAFENDDNQKQIVECNALPALVLMLRSEDPTTRFAAVSVIEILVHSLPDIRKDVLQAGALQPVICLLSDSYVKTQILAAFLLGLFAALDSNCKVHISQRGAIPPLIDMLKSPDAKLQEMSAFALRRLAQDSHNQASIAHNGGIEPFLNLLDSDNARIQGDAAYALYRLADNEDVVANIIKAGGFKKLKDGHFRDHLTKEVVAITLKKLEKMQGQVLKQLIYLMRFAEKGVQRCVAIALAYLCSPPDCKTIFIDNNGLELLLDILESPNIKQKGDASAALYKLAAKASSSVFIFDTVFPSTTPQDISVENVSLMYKMSEDFNATTLKNACILFMLEKFEELLSRSWYCLLVHRIVPDIRMFFSTLLTKSHPTDS